MKKYFKFKKITFLSLFVLLIMSCTNDDNPVVPSVEENIVELLQDSPNFSTLVFALERAELLTTLSGNGPFTILAPTNTAFTAFLNTNGFANLDAVPVPVLRQVLLNHVIGANIRSDNFIGFQSGYIKTLAPGPSTGSNISLYFDSSQGINFNGVTQISSGGADIAAKNGTIHVVEVVIKLATVADFIVLDPNFAALETALKSQGQPNYVATLSTPFGINPAPFTVFAPVNSAFAAIPVSTPTETLTAILNHHVIPGNNIQSSAITNELQSPPTLEGDILTFSVVGESLKITDGAGNNDIIMSDALFNLQASNGVVHAVNEVLRPDTTN